MPNRIHLRDYTVEELRAMPDSPLRNWLAIQAYGGKLERTKGEWELDNSGNGNGMCVAIWEDGKPAPEVFYQQDYFGSEWSAAGRLMDHFAAKWAGAYLTYCISARKWYAAFGSGGGVIIRTMLRETAPDAITTAALVFARERMEANA
jgi:hypothetical protein